MTARIATPNLTAKSLALVFLFFVLASGRSAADPAMQALLTASGIEEASQALIRKVVESFITQNPAMTPYKVVSEDFFFAKGDFGLHHTYAKKRYAESFSPDEIRQLSTFFASDAGSKVRLLFTGSLPDEPTTDERQLINGFLNTDLGLRYRFVTEQIYEEVHSRNSREVFKQENLDELDARIQRLWDAGV